MKITLVSGLLGAGKTSFIRNCIDAADEKTVVLVNDFGSLGIDGDVISSGGLETIELPSGCVCCSLRMDLQKALTRISEEMKPEHLVVEPSGLASPAGVIEAIETIPYSRLDIVGIVDASEFLELYKEEIYGPFFLEQVKLADIVLVNKIDLAEKAMVKETTKVIEKINPHAIVIETVDAKVEGGLPGFEPRDKDVQGNGHGLDMSVSAFKLVSDMTITRARELFSRISAGEFGKIVRAKALVHTPEGPHKFDLVWGKTGDAPFEAELEGSRLVVIGSDIREQELKKAFGFPDSLPLIY